MLSYAELDSKIALSRLNIHHQGVKMGFGMDGNIKGADNFPLYKRGVGIISDARPGIDALMFHSSHEYDVKPARRSHSPSPNINPPIRSNEYNSSPRGKTPHEMTGVMSRFYGLPPERDIVIENFAAEATGLSKSKTPERDFMIANMRADADANEQGFQGRDSYNAFMKSSAVVGLIEGGKTVAEKKILAKGIATGGATQMQRIFRGHTARKVAPIVVAPAFDAATATTTATATATATATDTATATAPSADVEPATANDEPSAADTSFREVESEAEEEEEKGEATSKEADKEEEAEFRKVFNTSWSKNVKQVADLNARVNAEEVDILSMKNEIRAMHYAITDKVSKAKTPKSLKAAITRINTKMATVALTKTTMVMPK